MDPSQKHYDLVGRELQERQLKAGLWARAVAETKGEGTEARARYIALRVAELDEVDRLEADRLDNEARQEAKRKEQAARQGSKLKNRKELEKAFPVVFLVFVLAAMAVTLIALLAYFGKL